MTSDELTDDDSAEPEISGEADASTTEVSPPADTGDEAAKRSRIARRSLAIVTVCLILLFAALNWPYQQATYSSARAGSLDSAVDFPLTISDAPQIGGWPYRYLIRYDGANDSDTSVLRFSWVALLYNLGLAAFVSACVLVYVARRAKLGRLGATNLSIADLLLLTFLLAGSFGWWQHVGAQYEKELEFATELRRQGGSYTMSAWIPAVLESRMPQTLKVRLQRLRVVRLEHPTQDMLSKLVDRPLTVLRIGGGEYDLRLLDRLAANPHLDDLRVAGRQLDSLAIHAMIANRRLHTLNLVRTNISAQTVGALEQLPDLRRLSLIHTDVVLSDLGTPGWSRTIEELRLPHPMPGDEASVRISGWPKLERLIVNELESQMNSTAMRIELEDLPALQHLGLDVFQKFDLKLRNLPQLSEIKELDFEWTARIPRGGAAPGHVWLGSIDGDGLPALEELYFFTPGLKHFRIVNAPKFKMAGVAAFFRTFRNARYAPELKKEVAVALIEGIGASEGPELVDLDAVPLSGVDLSPLANNEQLTHIKLSQSGTELAQWKGLEPMKWLTRFEVLNCKIDSAGINWVLEAFPNLEHFGFSGSGMAMDMMTITIGMETSDARSLEIVDRPKLKTIDLGDMSMNFFSTVRVVNSPNLKLSLELAYVEQIELSGAESIQGLSIGSPPPRDTKLSGLRDLSFFAVGGPTVTDELIKALENCEQLTLLTLAYPSVTSDGLRAINNLKKINVLSLPGTPLDDSIVAEWPQIPMLSHLDASDTKITGKSLRKLISGNSANRVFLDRAPIGKSDLAILAKQPGLTELSLVDVGIDAQTLGAIFDGASLQELDLSDSEVTAEMLDVIAQKGASLRYLALRNVDCDPQRLAAVVQRHRQLVFDLDGSNVPTGLIAQLVSARRVANREEWAMRKTQMAAMSNTTQAGVVRGFMFSEPEYPAKINVQMFANLANSPDPNGLAPGGQNPGIVPGPTQGGISRFGRWLGGAIFGSQGGGATPPGEPADVETTDVDSDDNREAEETPTEVVTEEQP